MLLQHFGYVVHSFKWNIVRVPLGVRVKEIPQYVVTLSSIKWIILTTPNAVAYIVILVYVRGTRGVGHVL